MRRKLYNLIRDDDINDIYSNLYDTIMMFAIVVSIIPMAFKETNYIFEIIEKISVSLFIIDYLFRFATADFKLNNGKISFVKYPFTPMAIIDIISIIPTFSSFNNSFKLLRILRLFKTLKVLRMFKFFRYSKSLPLIIRVFKREKQILSVVGAISLGYIFMSALIVFNVEPESFNTFFDAIYWATVSLTTVGYGDIYPVTYTGRIVTMISSIFGIAIIALPSGIITAGFINELKNMEGK